MGVSSFLGLGPDRRTSPAAPFYTADGRRAKAAPGSRRAAACLAEAHIPRR
jgi:hypothetical protein